MRGVLPPYDKTKRMVIPDALKVLRLQTGHKYCLLGRLSSEVGWGYADTIKELEEKRKQRAKVAYERKKQLAKLRHKAEKAAEEKFGAELGILCANHKYHFLLREFQDLNGGRCERRRSRAIALFERETSPGVLDWVFIGYYGGGWRGDSEDIELGLTLGGCFGSHRREINGLVRFASIPAVLPRDLVTMEPLARTCSLPSETEEELMRRKELQILKRMEAKRKREEKELKRTSERFEANLESWPVEKKRRMELENGTSWMSASNGSAKEVLYNSGLPNWITADSRPATPLKNFTPASQGSAVSQGSSFSGGSE
ncbi:hypothetical protein HPP92_023329 [Vanilla planifolia]|uniref:Ninja-family protein n=1 Tax=Vanilla planifolia TaxID=51239 RepID=A0A835PXF3_VANPL|nr:hypothetical protein HPP92_023329 [Vanilla planifolia]